MSPYRNKYILLATSQAALVWQEQKEQFLPLEAPGSSRKSVTKKNHHFTGRKAHFSPFWFNLSIPSVDESQNGVWREYKV